MNGLNSIGGSNPAAAPASAQGAEGSDFDAIFQEGLINTTAVMFQFLGADILETVMKDETSVD